MEKKTIGSFIAVLRKAAGLTQRELAERLNVSDKSVSRWERDECAPDLSLIPVIAEIFDITTDELLRGERKTTANEEAPHAEEESVWKKEKSTRQFQNLLRTQNMKLKERSLISIGVTFGGYLAALICNFAFLKALLGFFLALAFYAAAIILEICFLRRATVEEDDAFDYGKWLVYQNDLVKVGVKQFFIIWLFFGATLPLLFVGDAFYGMMLGGYLVSALISTVACFLLGYLVYILAIKPALIKKGTLFLTEEEKEKTKKKQKLLAKTSGISTAIAAILLISCIFVTECAPLLAEPLRFDSYEDFKEYMETETVYTHMELNGLNIIYGYTQIAPDSEHAYISPKELFGEDFEETYILQQVTDKDGNILCEYYHKNQDVARIGFSFDKSPDGLPVYVQTNSSMNQANAIAAIICTALIALCVLDVIIAICIYLKKARKYHV